jgi:hypothetical protein
MNLIEIGQVDLGTAAGCVFAIVVLLTLSITLYDKLRKNRP